MDAPYPCLWFDGRAEEAARFYVSLFPDSRVDAVLPFPVETPGGKAGSTMLVEFTLRGSRHMALNGGPNYRFTPAVSLVAPCADQAEIDRLWDAFCDGGTPIQCGWVTDRFGLSWQVVPAGIGDMLRGGTPEQSRRVMDALMPMVRIDLAALQAAYAEGAAS